MDELKVVNEARGVTPTTVEPTQHSRILPAGLLHLGVVYIVWGSTYLAIRVAVREGSGFPPFTMGMTRVLLAGTLLLLGAALQRKRIRPSRREFLVLAGSGLLLWTGGNGLVTWAEQRAVSGLAALIIASVPIWVALVETLLDRRTPTLMFVLALMVGFAGIVLLSTPALLNGIRADILALFALLGASASWAAGTVLQSRRPVSLAPQVSAGYQLLMGGFGYFLLAISFREPRPTPIGEAWLAWGYLVVFGSLFAFTSYVQALRLLPTSVAMTYAYVNPVIAVLLGAMILDEPITIWKISGAALVLLGVAGVFRERYLRNKRGACA